jgi:diguanylate cyclase (GGDEF)-like protein/PAS domain S-box-containing protein
VQVRRYTTSELTLRFWAAFLLLLTFSAIFVAYVYAEKRIDVANGQRVYSLKVIGELRQSSDDLSRMVRSYIATGEHRFKSHFNEIIAIRNGQAARPINYHQVYWDLVGEDNQRPRPAGSRIALMDLAKDAGLTSTELAALQQAKIQSDALALIEVKAMQLLERPETDPAQKLKNKEQALLAVFDANYHAAKKAIMQPIANAYSLVGERTAHEVEDALFYAFSMRILFIFSGLLLFYSLWDIKRVHNSILGASVSHLYEQIKAMGRGEVLQNSELRKAKPGSIMSWLGATQVRLNSSIQERQSLIQSLQQKEQYQRTLIDSIPFVVWLKDIHGRYLEVNRKFAEEFPGKDISELTGKTDAELFDPQRALSHVVHDKQVLSAGEPQVIQSQHKIGVGQHWFETYKAPVLVGGEKVGTVGLSRDITLEHTAANKLRLSASVFTHAREGIMITDPLGIIIDINEAFTEITGYSAKQAIGCTPRLLQSERHDEQSFGALWQSLQQQGFWSGELWSRKASGEEYFQSLTLSAVLDEKAQLQHYVGLFSDITNQYQQQQYLEKIALYDGMTGLPNRSALTHQLQFLLKKSSEEQLLAIAYLDLDGFKEINDRHGHETGDQFLIALSERLKAQLVGEELLARIGGDEFVVLLPQLGDKKAGMQKIQQILDAVAKPLKIDEWMLSVSASVGLTFYPQADTTEAEQLIRQADHAMYQAKQDGKNRCHIFDTDYARSLRGHQETILEIRQALVQKQFRLFYQPKVNMHTGEVIGAEALIRWLHPHKGMVAPALFLPAIEQHSLGVELGYWVIEDALRQLAEWQRQGMTIPVSVNISAYHLQQLDFVNRLQLLLHFYSEVPPSLLQLEILETSALNDLNHVQAVMQACIRSGVSFALDDFGTGYSSLTYLKRLPASVLKIDQSFVRDMLVDPDDLAILKGIIVLANEFKREIVAEGVETTEHGELLLQLGCTHAQGYGIARPMPAEQFMPWKKAWLPPELWTTARVGSATVVSSTDKALATHSKHRAV